MLTIVKLLLIVKDKNWKDLSSIKLRKLRLIPDDNISLRIEQSSDLLENINICKSRRSLNEASEPSAGTEHHFRGQILASGVGAHNRFVAAVLELNTRDGLLFVNLRAMPLLSQVRMGLDASLWVQEASHWLEYRA